MSTVSWLLLPACFLQTVAPHQSPCPTRRNNKQAYLWTLRLWNDASSPCPYRVVSQRNASRRVGFTLLGKCFLRHADVGNGFGPPAGQFGKTALTVSWDEIWILTALPVLCASGALITCQGQNNYSPLCETRFYLFFSYRPLFFWLDYWNELCSPQHWHTKLTPSHPVSSFSLPTLLVCVVELLRL